MVKQKHLSPITVRGKREDYQKKIRINRENILENIYYAECRMTSDRHPDCRTSFASWSKELDEKYVNRYYHMFKTKRIYKATNKHKKYGQIFNLKKWKI